MTIEEQKQNRKLQLSRTNKELYSYSIARCKEILGDTFNEGDVVDVGPRFVSIKFPKHKPIEVFWNGDETHFVIRYPRYRDYDNFADALIDAEQEPLFPWLIGRFKWLYGEIRYFFRGDGSR